MSWRNENFGLDLALHPRLASLRNNSVAAATMRSAIWQSGGTHFRTSRVFGRESVRDLDWPTNPVRELTTRPGEWEETLIEPSRRLATGARVRFPCGLRARSCGHGPPSRAGLCRQSRLKPKRH